MTKWIINRQTPLRDAISLTSHKPHHFTANYPRSDGASSIKISFRSFLPFLSLLALKHLGQACSNFFDELIDSKGAFQITLRGVAAGD